MKLSLVFLTAALLESAAVGQAVDAPKPPKRKALAEPESSSSREIKLNGKLLLFPVSKEKRRNTFSVTVDGVLVHKLEGSLARDKDDVAWWSHLEVSEYIGKNAVLTLSPSADEAGLALIESSNNERHLLPLYDERMRPQFHHSQKEGWNNDPNGMVYYDGEYHLFWQCNPVGNQWGNMYWGHSTSRDMIHWTEQPRALRTFGGDYTPNRHPSMANKNCFSGSTNVDFNNSGGWQTGREKTLVTVFTDTGCGEAAAYSNDRGMTWTYYDKNPVIKHSGRDPKLVWYAPGKHWVIAVFDQVPDKAIGRNISFYSSTNLKDWTLNSKLPGFFECPELFELPVDGDKKNMRWVIQDASAKYVVGTFDGKTFTPDFTEKQTVHYGPFYASQCFSNPPDGRVVQIGWAKIGMGGDMPFNQAFSLPINLTLRKTKDVIRMFANPIEELNTLHDGKAQSVTNKSATASAPVSLDVDGQLFDIHVILKKGDAARAMLAFGGHNLLAYDFATETLDKVSAPLNDGVLKLRILVDRPMFEVIVNDGQSYRTAARQPAPVGSVSIHAEGGSVTVESLKVFKMNSIWKK